MVSGALTSDQEFFRDNTRKFLEAETPRSSLHAREHDEDGFDRAWWRRGAELGWTSFLASEEFGGGTLSGEGLLDLVLVAQEMGRMVAPGPLVPVNVVAEALCRSGSPEQCALVPPLVSGEAIATWAINEPGGAWSDDGIELRATASGDAFVLDGVKSLVESANQAEHVLVTARADCGLTQFLLPVASTGLTVTNEVSLDLGRRYATMTFAGVQAPASAIVGTVGGASDDVRAQLLTAGALQVSETCGAMSTVFDLTLEYLDDRYSFGRPLASYQALKHRMADQKMWLEACLGLATAAARAVQRGADNAASQVSAAMSYVGEKGTDLVQDCIQLHGGIGVTWDHDLHLFLRRVTVNRFTYGTPENHRERLAMLANLR